MIIYFGIIFPLYFVILLFLADIQDLDALLPDPQQRCRGGVHTELLEGGGEARVGAHHAGRRLHGTCMNNNNNKNTTNH